MPMISDTVGISSIHGGEDVNVSERKPMIATRSALGSKPALTDSELAEPRGFSFLRHSSLTLTAVLVDAGFFLKRATRVYGHQTPRMTINRT